MSRRVAGRCNGVCGLWCGMALTPDTSVESHQISLTPINHHDFLHFQMRIFRWPSTSSEAFVYTFQNWNLKNYIWKFKKKNSFLSKCECTRKYLEIDYGFQCKIFNLGKPSNFTYVKTAGGSEGVLSPPQIFF